MKNVSGFQAEDLGLSPSYMPRLYSSVWKFSPPDWRERLDGAAWKVAAGGLPPLFFRADDIGVGGQAFDALCRLFRHHQVPLALAVVPAWLSEARQERLFGAAPMEESLWGWHQHGWRHINWERTGRKKSEFGEDRSADRQHSDILKGCEKMASLFGPHFTPVFTPPWNRFSAATLKVLRALQFAGISVADPLSGGARPPSHFQTFLVELDLHTRKAKDPAADFTRLADEFRNLSRFDRPVGIMIHHQRMTPFAFEFLERLLYNLKHVINARFLSFREIAKNSNEKTAGARLC